MYQFHSLMLFLFISIIKSSKKLSGKIHYWTLTTYYYLKTTLLKKVRVCFKGYLHLVSGKLFWYCEILEKFDWYCFEIRNFCPGKKIEKNILKLNFYRNVFDYQLLKFVAFKLEHIADSSWETHISATGCLRSFVEARK